MIGCQLTIALVISEYDPYRRQEIVTVIDGTDLRDGEGEALLDGTGTGTAMVLRHGGTWTENAMKKSRFKYLQLYLRFLVYYQSLRHSMVSDIHERSRI